jgi:hypothetical protein
LAGSAQGEGRKGFLLEKEAKISAIWRMCRPGHNTL